MPRFINFVLTQPEPSPQQSALAEPLSQLSQQGVHFAGPPQLLGCPRVVYTEIYDNDAQLEPQQALKISAFRERIRFGQNAYLDSSSAAAFPNDVVKLTLIKRPGLPAGQIQIGDHCCLQGTAIVAYQSVQIGDYALFGPQVVIMDCDGHSLYQRNSNTEVAELIVKPVTIGHHVWIGYGCIILKGVSIGDGAVIGAGSVVSCDVPPYTLYAGNPAVFRRCLDKNNVDR